MRQIRSWSGHRPRRPYDSDMHLSSALPLFGIGALFSGIGLVLVTNFKGAATWHAKASLAMTDFMRHIPPWSMTKFAKKSSEERVAWAVAMDRFIGGVFTLAGGLVLCLGIATLLGWASGSSQ